ALNPLLSITLADLSVSQAPDSSPSPVAPNSNPNKDPNSSPNAPSPRSRPVVEDSILFRVMVQLLVITGIGATAIAAVDVAEPLTSIYWAIPLSITGSIWSYFQRRKRNIGFKFLIALGMLIALATFFNALVERANDTRLILAELLIQLQALHCFDLPRRKDLGYSIVIGLILMGVGANISQTLKFAPFLVLFLGIALPVMVLDYRSRLGLTAPLAASGSPSPSRAKSRLIWPAELAPRRLATLLGVSLALGLLVFALLPRLPGYQLRSYPVSTPLTDLPEFTNNQLIRNPAYRNSPNEEEDRDGDGIPDDPSAVQGGSGSPTSGPGELDDEYYYGFNTTINQNLRSRPGQQMQPRIVMRVRSQAEGFWRVMSFDRYTGQGWEISRNDKTQTLQRPGFTYRFLLPRFWPIGRSREVVQTYTITDELPNLVPALSLAKELYFPTSQVAIDPEGGIRAPVELTDGTTYTVVSDVPYRDRTALGEAGTDYPPPIRGYYLELPDDPALQAKIRQKTEELLATSPKPFANHYERSLYLAQQLKQRYEVQPELRFLEEGEDLVEAFLFRDNGGYLDHFSTVLTIMLRSIGIPARLVAGFGSGEFNPFTGLYLVRNTDAYTMTEVYFPQLGWFAFDPIPGHPLVPPSLEESYAFSTLKKLWLWVAGWIPSPVRGVFSTIFLWLTTTATGLLVRLFQLFSQGIGGILLGSIILTGLGFVGWLLGSAIWRWRRRRRLARLVAIDRLYQELLHWLTQRDLAKRAPETPREYADRLRATSTLSPAAIAVIHQILTAYEQWRYGAIILD
ncbi:MAG: transglutaminase TgpA family protein, partial [Prochlorothrix sp.]